MFYTKMVSLAVSSSVVTSLNVVSHLGETNYILQSGEAVSRQSHKLEFAGSSPAFAPKVILTYILNICSSISVAGGVLIWVISSHGDFDISRCRDGFDTRVALK